MCEFYVKLVSIICVTCRFYGEGIRAADILYGKVTPPEECWALYEVLEQHGTLQQDNSDHNSSGTSSRATSSYYDNMTLNQSTSKHTKESNWFSKSSWADKAVSNWNHKVLYD